MQTDDIMVLNGCNGLQDMGTLVMGKVESGGIAKGMTLTLMPNKVIKFVHVMVYTLFILRMV